MIGLTLLLIEKFYEKVKPEKARKWEIRRWKWKTEIRPLIWLNIKEFVKYTVYLILIISYFVFLYFLIVAILLLEP